MFNCFVLYITQFEMRIGRQKMQDDKKCMTTSLPFYPKKFVIFCEKIRAQSRSDPQL